MTQISASDVGKLRRQTGSGMMDCKKALIESNGDIDKAKIISCEQDFKPGTAVLHRKWFDWALKAQWLFLLHYRFDWCMFFQSKTLKRLLTL